MHAASSGDGSHIGRLNAPDGNPSLRTAYFIGMGLVVMNMALIISPIF